MSYNSDNPEHRKRNAAYQARWYTSNKEMQFKRNQERADRIKAQTIDLLTKQICSTCTCAADVMLDSKTGHTITLTSLLKKNPSFKRVEEIIFPTLNFVCKECFASQFPTRNSNLKRQEQLGMPFGTAANKLRKSVLFMLVQQTSRDMCFKCQKIISTVDELSIEHKVPWLNNDPGLFWDLENIAFSHLRCNRPN